MLGPQEVNIFGTVIKHPIYNSQALAVRHTNICTKLCPEGFSFFNLFTM
jgi:hypothetical protein